MNLQKLLELYQYDDRLKKIAGVSLSPDTSFRISLQQLKASAVAFVAVSICKATKDLASSSPVHHVFVLDDREQAAYFHNDLEHLASKEESVLYFPDSFKKEGDLEQLNKSHVMLRTEALSKISQGVKQVILVSHPEALIEKVVNAQTLKREMVHFEIGQPCRVDDTLARLISLGFVREDFVYEPGQFAMRGGILDIYSFGNDYPYRIELFGDEIDSIRLFDPQTQLSERKVEKVSILPNIETQFEKQEKISLLDYLPDNTMFWFKDIAYCYDKICHLHQILSEKIASCKNFQKAVLNEEKKQEWHIDNFETPTLWLKKINNKKLIEWSGSFFAKNKQEYSILTFDTESQPVFNRNFDLLKNDLEKRTKEHYSTFIFAENIKQLDRLRSIFDDIAKEITFVPIPISISEGFIDHEKKILVYTDHQIFQRFHKYKVKQAYSKGKAITLKTLRELQPGDFVSHIDHGVGRYSGLQKIEVNGNLQEAVRIIYRDNDVLYVNINSLHKISKYTGKDGTEPKVNKLGSDAWEKLKNKTKKQVKDIAANLIKLYAKRKAFTGFAHYPDNYLQTELEASFYYEDTPDQSKAVADVKRDMESPSPMDRLICGDVGFGKTEVAVRAAFKTVNESKQAAILVPTTILAFQHYRTFSERLKGFPATVDYVNRFKSVKEKKETLKRLEEGKIDIIIGTHALLGKDVKFKDLGLLVIDEEQKFGVGAKEKLREKKANVDTLTLTATPIPRTLQFSLMSARDMSVINTPPPNRQPVHTELVGFNEIFIREAIYYETNRGGQVYFIHNRVQSLPSMVEKIKTLCPDLEIATAHGQMEGNRLEKTLMDFINYKYDVLCCTNIVESGVDIPNANTIIINNAHQFGLSDLHQLRGRVGRSNKKAFCYLVAPSLVTLPGDSRKRLQALEQFNELGSGFQISMRDLDIRGAGNLLGGEQSGFIAEIGYEMYQKILNEAIRELKHEDFKEVFAEEMERKSDFVQDCTIDTDLEILIPDEYVENISERLSLYTKLDHIQDEHELINFEKELNDRFGKIPTQVQALFTTVRCRKLAKDLGFERLILKNKQLRLYFVSNPESPYFESNTFQGIMKYIQTQSNKAKLKQVRNLFMLIVNDINNMDEVEQFLKKVVVAVV